MLSAQLAAQSQWCAAQYCPHDAEPSGLCVMHERLVRAGVPVVLHTITQPDATTPMLPCSTCHEWKPDEAFCIKTRKPHRRYRNPECRACQSKRRPAPSAICTALTINRDNSGQIGRPCRAHAVPGSPYCSSHGGLA